MIVMFVCFSDPYHSSSQLRRASSAGLPLGCDWRPGIFAKTQSGVSVQQERLGVLCTGNNSRHTSVLYDHMEVIAELAIIADPFKGWEVDVGPRAKVSDPERQRFRSPFCCGKRTNGWRDAAFSVSWSHWLTWTIILAWRRNRISVLLVQEGVSHFIHKVWSSSITVAIFYNE